MTLITPKVRLVRVCFAYAVTTFRRISRIGAPLILLLVLPLSVRADLILDLSPSSLMATRGETVIFTGKITNTTGFTLSTTDMFLNVSGFDPFALTDITQLLG